jgi:hypothetical protein
MKGILLAVSVVINCDKGDGPACKDAIEKAFKAAHLSDREITMTIGRCDQQTWAADARQCIAAATTGEAIEACGTKFKLDVPKANTFAAAMKAMSEFKDRMCACQSTACAQAVSDDMTKWAEQQAKDQRDPPKLNEDDVKRATAIGEEMGKCMQRAMMPPPEPPTTQTPASSAKGKMPF